MGKKKMNLRKKLLDVNKPPKPIPTIVDEITSLIEYHKPILITGKNMFALVYAIKDMLNGRDDMWKHEVKHYSEPNRYGDDKHFIRVEYTLRSDILTRVLTINLN